MNTLTLNSKETEMVNALWTIYKGLGKKVQRAFIDKIELAAVKDKQHGDLSAGEAEALAQGLADIAAGRTHAMRPDETLDEFLDRVEPCIK